MVSIQLGIDASMGSFEIRNGDDGPQYTRCIDKKKYELEMRIGLKSVSGTK